MTKNRTHPDANESVASSAVLQAGYAAMAADEAREAWAHDWAEATIQDVEIEPNDSVPTKESDFKNGPSPQTNRAIRPAVAHRSHPE
jgi:hypothetical protein